MSISSVSELEASLIILLDQTPLQVDQEGTREREDGERGGEWAFIRGRRLSSIFPFKRGTTSLSAPEVKKFVPSGCYEVT